MKGVLLIFFLLVSLIWTSCSDDKRVFRQLQSSESGVTFVNRLQPTDELNILTYLYYYNGGGVAIADFNADGLNDIYFTSNQGQDKIYLNKGGLVFNDVTAEAGIANASGWTTGVTHVDINNDGLLDIYVCKVSGHNSLEGSNLLFVNQGPDNLGIPVFKEDAKSYGLDISTLSTQSAFFDYDLDGDLDMFLLTHSVYPNRSYGKGSNRTISDITIGDRLYENVNGEFVDVSSGSNIFQSKTGYGLGVAISDFNRDGFPDIYVGNDFFENDYYYRNNGNKTFRELISDDPTAFGHTTHYSMGNCAADLNNDGWVDILSVDMLPADLNTLKSSGVEDGFPVYGEFLRNGYAPQFMQNTLHLNRGKDVFSEIAFQAGIAATEWSWGALAADFDMDGFRDVFITNGIPGATNDMDYINFISQQHIQKQIDENSRTVSLDLAKQIPAKKVANYFFRNSRDVSFVDVTQEWIGSTPSFSNGGAYGDLDNDGDLDLVVNNINDEAFVYENTTNNKRDLHYLTIRFKGSPGNPFGVGARTEVYSGDLAVYSENFPVKSYLSSVPNEIVVALGKRTKVDSMRVIWPDMTGQTFYEIKADQVMEVFYSNRKGIPAGAGISKDNLLENHEGIDFLHRENPTLDFDRDPLVPFALSNEGPAVAVADINGDSLGDLFIGGAKMQAGRLFMQDQSGALLPTQEAIFNADLKSEDVDQIFFDADGDADMDLLVVAGGNEFTGGDPLKPRLYINQSGKFTRDVTAFDGIHINASVVKFFDFENDGDNDILIGSNGLAGRFGDGASNLLFINNGNAKFDEAPENSCYDFKNGGLINDLDLRDIDKNGFLDIVAVGDWMPVTIFFNDGKSLKRTDLKGTEGWWNAVAIEDFDKDGDWDFVAGNWGLNTRLTASQDRPIELFRNDFDGNGAVETLVTYWYDGRRTLLPSKDELQRQLPSVKKRFQSYKLFAAADVDEVFDAAKLNQAMHRKVNLLSSCYFENRNNAFVAHALPQSAQQSTVNAIFVDDFNNDSFPDMLLAGNDYEISTQLGRLDASHGVLLINNKKGFFAEHSCQSFNIAGPARDIAKIEIAGHVYYVISINNDRPVFLKKVR